MIPFSGQHIQWPNYLTLRSVNQEEIMKVDLASISALWTDFSDKWFISIRVLIDQKAKIMTQVCFKGHASMDIAGWLVT